jgi:monofunctional biosynthetic peptidoglycan transglycosylase
MMRRLGRYIAAAVAFGFGYVAWIYLTLPDVRPLRTQNPASTAFMDLRVREARAQGIHLRYVHQPVPYGRISPHLKRAVLVAEDAGFWEHKGIDLEEIKKSLEADWERGALTRGASTITQQLAKNLYLSPSRNPVRKLTELFITWRLEHELTKTRIFELYLNNIEWGNGIWGAEAAAQEYFNIPASAVGPDQAALMAGAIINPRVLDISRPNARLRARQRIIRARMGNVTPPPILVTRPQAEGAPPDVEEVPEEEPVPEEPDESGGAAATAPDAAPAPVPGAPGAPGAPTAPNAPDAPSAPNAPTAPSAPIAPSAPNAPNTPSHP